MNSFSGLLPLPILLGRGGAGNSLLANVAALSACCFFLLIDGRGVMGTGGAESSCDDCPAGWLFLVPATALAGRVGASDRAGSTGREL